MILKTNNGDKEINVKELDFVNIMCDLEDNDVDVMALMDSSNTGDMKIFKTIRAIVAVLIGEKDLNRAGKIFTEHMRNGGTMDEIMDAFTEAMEDAGFGDAADKATETEPTAAKKKTNSKITAVTQS